MLNGKETAEATFARVGAVAKTSDFIAAGLSRYDVAKLCKQSSITRVKNGFYRLPASPAPTEEELIAVFLPRGIVCVESALYHYGYSDFAPRKWSVAVPRSYSRAVKQASAIPLKAYYIGDSLIDLGKTTGDFSGVTLPVYDRERTLCDCFKYRSKLEGETFAKAVNAYAADPEKNLGVLADYAKALRVYDNLMRIMEVLLNG